MTEKIDSGGYMDDKLCVLDVALDDCSAKESMKTVIDYIETEMLNSVELVTTDMLMLASRTPALRENMESLDLVLPGDRSVLEAAGVTDKRRLQEAQDRTFLKMVLRYLHKNRLSVFLLADTAEEAERLCTFLADRYSGIVLSGSAVFQQESSADDGIINQINGAQNEVDCVLACLSSPDQEAFLCRCRPLLNARLWLAPGKSFIPEEKKGTIMAVREFIEKKILKREVERTKREAL